MKPVNENLKKWLKEYYPDKYDEVRLGKEGSFTPQMQLEYLKWCRGQRPVKRKWK